MLLQTFYGCVVDEDHFVVNVRSEGYSNAGPLDPGMARYSKYASEGYLDNMWGRLGFLKFLLGLSSSF